MTVIRTHVGVDKRSRNTEVYNEFIRNQNFSVSESWSVSESESEVLTLLKPDIEFEVVQLERAGHRRIFAQL